MTPAGCGYCDGPTCEVIGFDHRQCPMCDALWHGFRTGERDDGHELWAVHKTHAGPNGVDLVRRAYDFLGRVPNAQGQEYDHLMGLLAMFLADHPPPSSRASTGPDQSVDRSGPAQGGALEAPRVNPPQDTPPTKFAGSDEMSPCEPHYRDGQRPEGLCEKHGRPYPYCLQDRVSELRTLLAEERRRREETERECRKVIEKQVELWAELRSWANGVAEGIGHPFSFRLIVSDGMRLARKFLAAHPSVPTPRGGP